MSCYRLYTVGTDGRFCNVEILDLETDSEACEIAAVHLKDHPAIEMWQEARRVALVTQDGAQIVDPAG